MSGIFETSTHTTKQIRLPAGTTKSAAVAVLHDHDTVIRFDPNLIEYSTLPSATATTKTYSVIDNVDNMPKALGLDKSTSTQELTNNEDGIELAIKAAMGIVITQTWTVKSEGSDLVIDFVSDVKGTRLLVGVLTKQLGANWDAVSKTLLEKVASA